MVSKVDPWPQTYTRVHIHKIQNTYEHINTVTPSQWNNQQNNRNVFHTVPKAGKARFRTPSRDLAFIADQFSTCCISIWWKVQKWSTVLSEIYLSNPSSGDLGIYAEGEAERLKEPEGMDDLRNHVFQTYSTDPYKNAAAWRRPAQIQARQGSNSERRK